MDQRPTQQLTVGEHTFTVKTYATAREENEIRKTYYAGADVSVEGVMPKISKFDPTTEYTVSLKMVEILAVDMDGSAEKIRDRVEELPAAAFDELIEKLNELTAKKKN